MTASTVTVTESLDSTWITIESITNDNCILVSSNVGILTILILIIIIIFIIIIIIIITITIVTSCGGTSNETVLRSTFWYASIQGITKKIPGGDVYSYLSWTMYI